jgi:DNA-binding CsgD family transcriptional regulator
MAAGLDALRRSAFVFARPVVSAGVARLADSTAPIADAAALDRLIGAIYDGPMQSPPWAGALRQMREALRANHVLLIPHAPTTDFTDATIESVSPTAAGAASCSSLFFTADPFVGLSDGDVVTADRLLGQPGLDRHAYAAIVRSCDVRHLLGADLHIGEGLECRLRATRPRGAPKFSEQDKALCRRLLPHLKRSIRLHARIDSLECEHRLFAGTVGRVLLGTVIFNHCGAIIETDPEARRILSERDGIRRVGNTLGVDSRQEHRELQAMIRRKLPGAVDAGNPGIEVMSLSRPSGRPSLSALVRAIPQGGLSPVRQRPTVALLLRDPEHTVAPPSSAWLRKLFGLTRTEATLAMLLAEGDTLYEAAAKLNVRRNTVRTHLRAIFAKTGVARQATLVRLLLNGVISVS